MKKGKKLNHYVAIKYHVKVDYPAQCIGLHNFENGYCGISAIEDGEHCLCYMTTAENLTACGNSVSELEKRILCRNPFLKEIFSSATSVFEKPLAISQISFEKKSVFENHSLLVGDAAGVIPPLSGNGMSMALHGSKIAFRHIKSFLEGKTDRTEMENAYEKDWQMNFGRRMAAGRILQKFFGSPLLSDLLILSIKPFPKFVSYLIRQTHGAPY
jgi:flavin-dependent dehydrogenase